MEHRGALVRLKELWRHVLGNRCRVVIECVSTQRDGPAVVRDVLHTIRTQGQVVFERPMDVGLQPDADGVRFEVYRQDVGQRAVFASGSVELVSKDAAKVPQAARIDAQAVVGRGRAHARAEVAAAFDRMGLELGPSFQLIDALHSSDREAYARLILDVMLGDQTLFTRADEVNEEWSLVDAIVAFWQRDKPAFPNYPAGTWGPHASDELLHRDGRSWRRH